MDELSLLIGFLQSAKSYAGKRKVQLQENMKFLFTTHGSLLVEAIVAYWEFAITE